MFPVVAAISVPVGVTVGASITNPRPITGAWEQRTTLGSVVGLNIEISTDALGAPKSLQGVTQRVMKIWIKTYVRKNGRSQRTFWSNGYDAQFNWQKDHLVLHQPAGEEDGKPVDLDVVFDSRADNWRGTLQNEWFTGKVQLGRPYVPHIGFPIIGDWIEGSARSSGFACRHVALGGDSGLVIWDDYINLPGFIIYGQNGTVPPLSTPEWYGNLDMDAEMKYVGDSLLFFTGTDMGGQIVLGNVAADRATFVGSSAHFGNGISNGAFNPLTWRRSTPDCGNP
ncbi:MAG: hypothetical protein M3N19_01400 [Candidatus Eremiobacteraeota bacterium]|nr:hypothetical protein [Candidatus Eremiobacteraeota bacterium]